MCCYRTAMENKYVIIVAGGKGERMKSSVPKQYLEISGRPLMMYTLAVFAETYADLQIVVVLPPLQIHIWKELCHRHNFEIPHQIAEGGPTRFHSVKSGLQKVPETGALIAIHDAVRPLVSKDVIRQCFDDAGFYGNAIPVIPLSESLRERNGSTNRPARRESFVLVQTPQCFRSELIKHAYLQNYREEFTDDASVLESDGHQIHLVNGNPENIKITTPVDLAIAEALLKK